MSIILCAVGDVMIGRSFNETLSSGTKNDIWGDTKRIFDSAHIVIGNLETTLTLCNETTTEINTTQEHTTNEGNEGGFYFHLNSEYAGVLRDLPFDYLGIANNHILDYQETGLFQTIDTLNSLGICHSGAGKNRKEARRPCVFKIKTLSASDKNLTSEMGVNKIAIFSASDHPENWKATSDSAGLYFINHDNPENALDFFQYYKSLHPNTFIVLNFHWGANYERPAPPLWKRHLAIKLFNAGVDLILGTSPHHTEPYENINGKYVFYSLGDFIDDYAIDPNYRNDIGGIARISIDVSSGKVKKVKIYPTIIHNSQVNLL